MFRTCAERCRTEFSFEFHRVRQSVIPPRRACQPDELEFRLALLLHRFTRELNEHAAEICAAAIAPFSPFGGGGAMPPHPLRVTITDSVMNVTGE
jgi:hypothetical protein